MGERRGWGGRRCCVNVSTQGEFFPPAGIRQVMPGTSLIDVPHELVKVSKRFDYIVIKSISLTSFPLLSLPPVLPPSSPFTPTGARRRRVRCTVAPDSRRKYTG